VLDFIDGLMYSCEETPPSCQKPDQRLKAVCRDHEDPVLGALVDYAEEGQTVVDLPWP